MIFAWKVRIAVLWLAAAVCQSAGVALLMLDPGFLRGAMAGEWNGIDTNSAAVQINTAFYWVGCLSLAFLTLVLNDRANRWVNALAAATSLVNVISSLALDGAFAGADVITVFMILILLLVLWHVWKWPTEVTAPVQQQEATRRGA